MNDPMFAELVFGFVYPVGTDADPVVTVLKNYLQQYQYTTDEFRVSKQLRSLNLGILIDPTSKFAEMTALMDAGNEARIQAEDNGVLAMMAINDIASNRTEDEQQRPTAMHRTAHLIRSLKTQTK